LCVKPLVSVAIGSATLLVAAASYLAMPKDRIPSLMGEDVDQIRRDALLQFPIGTAVEVVAAGLVANGFACDIAPRPVENVTAGVVLCNSNGRSGGFSSAVFITVIARSGALTDLAVSNGPYSPEASALATFDEIGRRPAGEAASP
jgi:hypothetical protein